MRSGARCRSQSPFSLFHLYSKITPHRETKNPNFISLGRQLIIGREAYIRVVNAEAPEPFTLATMMHVRYAIDRCGSYSTFVPE